MPFEYTVEPVVNHTSDRVFTLELIDSKAPVSSTGLLDHRLFKGENKLHAIMDSQTCLWSLKYEQGSIPPSLRQRFTSFSRLKKVAEDYFATRNVKITEISD